MLSVLDEEIRCGRELGLGLASLSVASIELGSGVTEDIGGVLNFSLTERDFSVTFATLALIEVIMGNLLRVYLILEVVK